MFSFVLLVVISGELIRIVVFWDFFFVLLWLLYVFGSWVVLDYGFVNVGLYWFFLVDFGFWMMIVIGGCFLIIEKEFG